MRLIKAQHGELDRTDQEIVRALSPYAGIVVTGYKPVQNGQVRDLDLIVIFPSGVLAIEGKGSYGKTGELHWNINGSWDIGGDRTAFKPRPNEQVRKAAQLLKSGTWAGEPVHVSEAVVVCGEGVTLTQRIGGELREHPIQEMYEDGWVCLPDGLVLVLIRLRDLAAQRRRAKITGEVALRLLAKMNLDPELLPTKKDLSQMGFEVHFTPEELEEDRLRIEAHNRALNEKLGIKPNPAEQFGELGPESPAQPGDESIHPALLHAFRVGASLDGAAFQKHIDPSMTELPPEPPIPLPRTEPRSSMYHIAELVAHRQVYAAFEWLRRLPMAEQEAAIQRLVHHYCYRAYLYGRSGWIDMLDQRRQYREMKFTPPPAPSRSLTDRLLGRTPDGPPPGYAEWHRVDKFGASEVSKRRAPVPASGDRPAGTVAWWELDNAALVRLQEDRIGSYEWERRGGLPYEELERLNDRAPSTWRANETIAAAS